MISIYEDVDNDKTLSTADTKLIDADFGLETKTLTFTTPITFNQYEKKRLLITLNAKPHEVTTKSLLGFSVLLLLLLLVPVLFIRRSRMSFLIRISVLFIVFTALGMYHCGDDDDVLPTNTTTPTTTQQTTSTSIVYQTGNETAEVIIPADGIAATIDGNPLSSFPQSAIETSTITITYE